MSQNADSFVAEAKQRRSKFIDLIKQQEDFARRNPAAYLRKVRFLAYLGYGYVLTILFILLAIAGGLIFLLVSGRVNYGILKILVFVLPVLYVVARSLYVKLEPPEGVELTRNDAPELFRAVDSISEKLGSIKFEKIIINDELNAMASQIPRFGILGPTKNYLVLGLPLLLTLTPDEARSVIAHEFGHFAGGHSRFSGWIYRLNRTWAAIQYNLAKSGGGSWLFQKFFDWFEPLFDATTFALRRQNEFEADAAAVMTVGAESAARALMRYPFVIPHLQNSFWTPLYDRAKVQPTPPRDALSGLVPLAKSPVETGTVKQKLSDALLNETSYDDTHPSLRDRVTAMGVDLSDVDRWTAELAKGVPQSAAEAFLGSNLNAIVERVNAHAVEQMAAGWAAYHERYKGALAQLTKLQQQRDEMPLTRDEEVEYVALTRHVSGDAAAEAYAKHAVERFPDDARCLAMYGDILLDRDNPEGVAYLQRARELRPEYDSAAYSAILAFYERTGQRDQAAAMQETVLNAHLLDSYTRQEASRLSVSDDFVPHDLTPGALETLKQELATCNEVGEAYAVRKVVRANAERVFPVLIVIPKTVLGVQKTNYDDVVDEVSQKLSTETTFIIYSPPDAKAWRKRLEEVPGALIYKRG